MIGSVDKVIVDKYLDDGWSICRSYRDAPEIDNFVRINGKFSEGDFLNVKYTKAFEYDLHAEVIK